MARGLLLVDQVLFLGVALANVAHVPDAPVSDDNLVEGRINLIDTGHSGHNWCRSVDSGASVVLSSGLSD
jgi:hypothetical protein